MAVRAEVARLYPDLRNQRKIAEALGVGQSTVGRHLRALGIAQPPAGRPVKYPPVQLGVCGTPGCTDPECDLPYGTCHCDSRRCWRTTPIAGKSDRRRRHIKGKHCLFVRGHDRLSDEGRRIQSAGMTAKMNALHADPQRKAKWAYRRHGSTRLYGRANRELAARKGKKVGPKFTEVDVVKAEKILGLSDEKNADGKPRHSQRAIARMVGVSRSSVRNVLANRGGVMAHFLIEKVG